VSISSLQEYSQPRLLLTGAGGWFGRTALYEYEKLYGPEALRTQVVPFASKARQIDFGSPYGPIEAFDLREISSVSDASGLLHLAFLTRDRVVDEGLDSYIRINRKIIELVGQVISRFPSIPVITTSSGASAALDGKAPDLEGNPYATLKQEEEALWYESASGRMVLIFRVYAASGYFMPRPSRFALGDFILQAMKSHEIIISAGHVVERSYVHVGSLMRLCWILLEKPLDQGCYNIDACSHRTDLFGLARLVAKVFNILPPKATIDNRLAPDVYVGESSVLLALCHGYGVAIPSLEQQIDDTFSGIRYLAKN
jgi:nucleoside-diphosphate-sugar epimerase